MIHINTLKEAVHELAIVEATRIKCPCDPPELIEAWRKVESAGKKDPQGVWDIIRNGTDAEFSALCNCIPDIGGEFDDDDNLREIMRIAKLRLENPQDIRCIMEGIQGCFGGLFDKFWEETGSAKIGQKRRKTI